MSLVETLQKASSKNVATHPHLVITARAGTGKTSTLIEALKRVKGVSKWTLTPSSQQQAIWDEVSKTDIEASACFVAFNRDIAKELQSRVPDGVDAMTLHSMGVKAVRAAYSSARMEEYKTAKILAHLWGKGDQFKLKKEHPELLDSVVKMVDLVKMNLAPTDRDSLIDIATAYEIEGGKYAANILKLVPRVLDECQDVDSFGFDFADMIWLPVVQDLSVKKYDLLFVDEAQDLNKCQQELTVMAGSRLVYCGDDKQAIYGFCGADSKSLPNLTDRLKESIAKCKTLPLTTTYRCGKAIVKEAQKLVKDFEAHESNSEGSVKDIQFSGEKGYRELAESGDMVLCRTNAPLVSECLGFLSQGRKATIRGRDVGKGLLNQLKKVLSPTGRVKDYVDSEENTVETLMHALSDWIKGERLSESKRKEPREARLAGLEDKYDCLMAFCDGLELASEVIRKVNEVFTNNDEEGISLSSIHKSKGLEARRVFILLPEKSPIPHPMAKSASAREQEYNLLYVAQTRAIEELYYVTEEK